MKRRFKLLYHWIFTQKIISIPFIEMFITIFSPFTCSTLGYKYIKKINKAKHYYEIIFKNISIPLYFPIKYDLRQLKQVSCELLDHSNWHCYEALESTKVNNNDIVIDCGAAEGLFALSIHKRAKMIYNIEPSQVFVNSMAKTFVNIKNIEILPIAVGNKNEEISIHDNGIYSSITAKDDVLKIQKFTIDSLFYDKGIKITYIKADIEGEEISMLQGAQKTIKEYLPKIVITTYHKKGDYLAIKKIIQDLDSRYEVVLRGMEYNYGEPVMLYAWIP